MVILWSTVTRIPPMYLHAASGRARVRLNGRDHYLGKWGAPETQAAYDRAIAEWLARGRQPMQPVQALTVDGLWQRFKVHAERYYSPTACRSRETVNLQEAFRPVLRLYGSMAAADFSPLSLKACRQVLVDAGLARSTINARVKRIRRVFKWAVSEALIPGAVLQSLQAVDGLKRGRSSARETDLIKPVAHAIVDATIGHSSPELQGMITVHLLTGMRSGELVRMTTAAVDTSGPVWLYRPSTHKTQWAGKDRIVPIGPRAQAILRPLLNRDLNAPIFVGPRRGRPYSVNSYRNAIVRAAKRAGVPEWTPLQLRHTAATDIRRECGLDAAQAILGHANVTTTQVYAERQLSAAVAAALRVG